MGAGGAAEQFWDEFRKLYEAADKPTLEAMVKLAEGQVPPARVTKATLSEWLNRKSVPSRGNSQPFLALAAALQSRPKARDAYAPRLSLIHI